MNAVLERLSPAELSALADMVEAGRLRPPFTLAGVQRYLPGQARQEGARIVAELEALWQQSAGGAPLVLLLRALGAEREAMLRLRDGVELVWTGPEVQGSTSRDTSVVVRELFLAARRSIVITSYALAHARSLFEPLARRMDDEPQLGVRMFLHVGRAFQEEASEAELLRRFADRFRREHWPGERLPEVFYDPRTLRAPTPGEGAVALHAKCVIVDESVALVTSANLTEAAQLRNIEAGAVVRTPGFARALLRQFEQLVAAQLLRRVPGLG